MMQEGTGLDVTGQMACHRHAITTCAQTAIAHSSQILEPVIMSDLPKLYGEAVFHPGEAGRKKERR